jgi:molybdopterin-guanine dinucleotide biosynthesis protein B
VKNCPNTVAFVASGSGAGKTSLVEALVPLLKAKGYRVGTVKHSRHDAVMDREGSDSWRFRRAGSDVTVLAAMGQLAILLAVDHPCVDDALH